MKPDEVSPAAAHFALIPAAGVGARMGAACPKQYLLLHGKPVLWHTVQAFLHSPGIDHTFVVVSSDDGYIDQVFPQPLPGLSILRCGGATRQQSVLQGLQAMQGRLLQGPPGQTSRSPAPQDWVLVHDAARPGLTPALVARLQSALAQHAVGGLLAMPVVDTVKQVAGGVVTTRDRNGLWLAQTPQMFRFQLLRTALQQADGVTDEASAIEMMGLVPMLVAGHVRNLKLTVPDDLALLGALMALAPAVAPEPASGAEPVAASVAGSIDSLANPHA